MSTGREELLTTAQAARAVGVSRMTLVRYEEKGYVTPARVLPSGHRRWLLSELERQLRDLREQTK